MRVTHSATLIDNIFTNNTTVSSKNGLIISDISDHLPIFSIVFGDYLRKDSNSFTIRDTSEKRVNEFRHKLENTNWDFSDQANNANDPLRQSIRKISCISNTFGIDEMKTFSNTKRIKTNKLISLQLPKSNLIT